VRSSSADIAFIDNTSNERATQPSTVPASISTGGCYMCFGGETLTSLHSLFDEDGQLRPVLATSAMLVLTSLVRSVVALAIKPSDVASDFL
jgi:hypothetical protein